MRKRGAHDVVERRLCSQRYALRAFGHQQSLNHQQAEPVLLSRKSSEQNSRRTRQTGKGIDCATQCRLQQFGIQVLFEYLQFATHPRFTYRAVERRNGLEHEALQALPHQQMRECVLKRRSVMTSDQREHVALEHRRGGFAARPGAGVRKYVQFGKRLMHELAGAHAGIHQALDHPQFGNLFG